MDEVKAPGPPDAWQCVWVSYDDEGFFSAPRTEAELRVYFEIAPGLVEQRQEGTTFENWVEECEHYGLLIPQRPDAPFLTLSWSRSDVAEILAGLILPDTDANIDAVISDGQTIDRLRDACTAAGHDVLLDGVERLAEADRLARHPVSVSLDAAFGSRRDVEVVPIEFINDLIEGGVQYWALTPGVFAAEEPGGGFTVVDNSTGDCFTETFASLTGALAYIDGAEPEDAHRIDLAPLPLDLITFGDEISECKDRLNFYIPVTFDCDAVFGTNVCSIDNDDWLNIYVDYDMARGEVADHLEISLNRADGKIEYLTYPLDAVQRGALLPKMDAYCKHETGRSLAEYVTEAMVESGIAEPGPPDLDIEARDMRGVSDGLSHDMDRSDRGSDAR